MIRVDELAEARSARYQDTVVLKAIIKCDGTVENVRMERSLGLGLDENAVQALKMWRFRPAVKNGQPVDVLVNIETNFYLR